MTKHDSKTADEFILDERSKHHTHTYENKGINLFAYFDKKISMWVIQNKHQSTVRFDDALDPPLYLRSLADITELVELRKKNAELIKFQESASQNLRNCADKMKEDAELIAELEQKLSHAETMGDKVQAIRDLEQQVTALEEASKYNVRMKRKFGSGWGSGHVIQNLQERICNLTRDVKQLRGGGNL